MDTLHHPLIYGLRGPLLMLGLMTLGVIGFVRWIRSISQEGKHDR